MNIASTTAFEVQNGSGTQVFGVNTGDGTNSFSTTTVFGYFRVATTTGSIDTPALYVGENGNVGIGTSDPGANLHVSGTYDPLFVSATSGKVAIFDTSFRNNTGFTIATTTYINAAATSTNFGVTSLAVAACDVKATTAGDLFCGTDVSSAGEQAWQQLFGFGGGDIAITPTTSSAGIFVTASSTIQSSLRVDRTLNVIGAATS